MTFRHQSCKGPYLSGISASLKQISIILSCLNFQIISCNSLALSPSGCPHFLAAQEDVISLALLTVLIYKVLVFLHAVVVVTWQSLSLLLGNVLIEIVSLSSSYTVSAAHPFLLQ